MRTVLSSTLAFAAVFAAGDAFAQNTWTVSLDAPGVEARMDEQGHEAIAWRDREAQDPPSTSALLAPDWRALGPFGGDMDDVQASPVNPSIILAGLAPSSGVGGGIYRSTDGGAAWNTVASLSGRFVHDIAFAPDGTAYAGTLDAVWKSTDGGATFSQLPLGIGLNDEVFEVSIDPSNPMTLWIGVADALGGQPVNVMVSTNGGAIWANKTPPLTSPTTCTCITVDPANSNKVYAGFGGAFGSGQVWVSTNGGTSWVNRSAGLPNPMPLTYLDPPVRIPDMTVGSPSGSGFERASWEGAFAGELVEAA